MNKRQSVKTLTKLKVDWLLVYTADDQCPQEMFHIVLALNKKSLKEYPKGKLCLKTGWYTPTTKLGRVLNEALVTGERPKILMAEFGSPPTNIKTAPGTGWQRSQEHAYILPVYKQ